MSHTDKTRPFWVKLGDNPSNYVPRHDHRFGPCDLPEYSRDYHLKKTSCTWAWSDSWMNSREARCDCSMCRGSVGRKVDSRKRRYSAAKQIKEQLD